MMLYIGVAVMGRLCVLRCLGIRRYKSSLNRQHNFIRDDRLYEGFRNEPRQEAWRTHKGLRVKNWTIG